MTKLKALGGILIGCIVMVIVGSILYNLNTVAYATGLLGAITAVFLGNFFSKSETPVFTAVMAAVLCLGTAVGISIYLPAKDVVDTYTDEFKSFIEDNETYRVAFLQEYKADPDFGLDYAEETDPDSYVVYEDWSYLTHDLDGDVDKFNDWFDDEFLKPYEDRQELSFWLTHPTQLLDKNDEYIGSTEVYKNVRMLLIFNCLGVIVSIIGLIGNAMKRR